MRPAPRLLLAASLWAVQVKAGVFEVPPLPAAVIGSQAPGLAGVSASSILLGQELTLVPPVWLRPMSVALRLAETVGGQAFELEPNGKAQLLSALGKWHVEHDGRFPGGAPIIEVGTPPLAAAGEVEVAGALAGLHALGPAVASVGGGHIHIDGAAFLASPRLLGRLLALYLRVEPALLSAFRHPARTHAARGFCEMTEAQGLREALSRLGDESPEGLPAALDRLYRRFGLRREAALNLRSLAGSAAGNKRSKGTIELRLFDSPRDAADYRRQHQAVRQLVAAALSSEPLPQGGPIADIESAFRLLSDAAGS